MNDKKDEKNLKIKTSIGGQALIEGIMMRGPKKTSIVVRREDGTLESKIEPTIAPSERCFILGWPIIRGSASFVSSLSVGMRALNYSASFFEDSDDQLTGFEKWLKSKTGDKFNDYIILFSMIVGFVLAIGLFFILPTVIARVTTYFSDSMVLQAFVEGVVRIIIFLGYIYLVAKIPDIKRVFAYHGAEHKTIACYEHGEELTVENVKKYSRFHPRCGTSFLIIIMVVSILVFSFVTFNNIFLSILFRLLLLPVVVGISYELLKLAGRYDNIFTRFISAPGIWLQKLTTQEPDDSMMEAAILAMNDVIPENIGEDKW